jgi:hypothetical protein
MKFEDLMKKYGDYEVTGIFDNDGDKPYGYVTVGLKRSEPKTAWDLRKGDKCYYISLFGDVEDTGGYLIPLSKAIDMGVVFLTEEDAKKDAERRKVETLLLRYGGRRWFNEHKLNWFIALENEVTHEPYVYSVSDRPKQGCIYFDTEEQAQKAISEIGEERIKKALFEVR